MDSYNCFIYCTFVVSKTSLFQRCLQQDRHFGFVLSWVWVFWFMKIIFQECTENLYGILLRSIQKQHTGITKTFARKNASMQKHLIFHSYFISILSGGVLKRTYSLSVVIVACSKSLLIYTRAGKQKYFQATTPLGRVNGIWRLAEYNSVIQVFSEGQKTVCISVASYQSREAHSVQCHFWILNFSVSPESCS